jgi:predicted amino acid dehydrogenase
VSVVQLEDDAPADPERISVDVAPEREAAATSVANGVRAALAKIASETTGFDTDVRVVVRLGGAERQGVARGSATSGLKLVAHAVIDALKDSIQASGVEVEFADVSLAGARQVAVVVLRLLTGRGDHVVVGSAIVRRDPNDAMAKAALDAVNRLVAAS